MSVFLTTPHHWTVADFQLEFNQQMSGNRVNRFVKDLGPEIWKAEYVSAVMDKRAADKLYAQFLGLRGGMDTFFGHVAEKPLPEQFAPNRYDGLRVDSTNGGQLRIKGLRDGFGISIGDYFTIKTGAGTELYMAVSNASLLPSGTSHLLSTVPLIRPSVQEGNLVVFENPYAEMVLEPNTLKNNRVEGLIYNVSFSATQVIR